jgi:serine/threonine protein kinase
MDPKPLSPTDPHQIGRWEIRARLGAGAMGVVYLAESDGQFVALKVIRPEFATDATFRERFRREIEAASRIDSPRVARVRDAEADADAPWMATDLIDGPSLADAVRANGPMPDGRLLPLALGIAEALSAIHAVGIVHRDVKPANVLLSWDGPRLVDFGIAQIADLSMNTLTSTGLVVGSPGFMSPEQARRDPVTFASDVFAWGCTVVYAASGEGPFGSGSTADVLYRVVHDAPRVPPLAQPLDAVVRAALRKAPAERPSVESIGSALHGEDIGATLAQEDAGDATELSPATSRSRQDVAPASRTGFVLGLVAVLIVLAAVGAYLWAAHHGDATNSASAQRPAVTTTSTTSSPTTSIPTTAATRAPASDPAQLVPRTPPNGSYVVQVPASWTFRDTSIPSDHSTHLWYNPTDPLEKLQVIQSGCTGCVFDEAGNPDPQKALPNPVESSFVISLNRPGFVGGSGYWFPTSDWLACWAA